MRRDDFVLVKQGETALRLKNALNHEHHIGTARVIFIKCQSDGVLQRPWQQPFAKLCDLLAVFENNRVFTDKVDTADMAIEVNPYKRPVEPRGDLLDMGGFTCAVISLHHNAAVIGKACADSLRGLIIKDVSLVNFGHMFRFFRKSRNLHVEIYAKNLAGGNGRVRGHNGESFVCHNCSSLLSSICLRMKRYSGLEGGIKVSHLKIYFCCTVKEINGQTAK